MFLIKYNYIRILYQTMPRLKLESKKHNSNPDEKEDIGEKDLIFTRSLVYKNYFENIKKIKKKK